MSYASGDRNPSKRPEVRKKISKALKGKKRSITHCIAISKAMKGKNHFKPNSNCKCCTCRGQRGEYKGEGNPNWRGGSSKLPYAFKFDDALREKIRKRDKNRCQVCGKTKKENKQNHTVHHIDYDKMNSAEDNLITLCRGCNCKVNFNREFWQELLCV